MTYRKQKRPMYIFSILLYIGFLFFYSRNGHFSGLIAAMTGVALFWKIPEHPDYPE